MAKTRATFAEELIAARPSYREGTGPYREEALEIKSFEAIRISLASPEQIRSWSYGEVTKPETINYRRLRPERDGLFCEVIFGPTKDYQCYCGKYKKVRHKGTICDKCGVEVTRAWVRRERMGHINLASPVAHIWYTRRMPSYLGLLLDVSRRNLDRVLYFAQYVITSVNEDARQKALHRFEVELERELTRAQKASDDRKLDIEEKLEKELQRLQKERDRALKAVESKLEDATDDAISQANKFQERLNKKLGEEASSDMVFPLTGAVIVSADEKIKREHLKTIKQQVEAKIDELEAQARAEESDIRLQHDAAQQEKQATAARERDEEDAAVARKLEEIRQAREAEREELKNLAPKQFLSEMRYRELVDRWGGVFEAGMGAEALYGIVKGIDLNAMTKGLYAEIRSSRSKQRRKQGIKQLRIVEALRKSANRPEWMILTVLPVIPPDLRPMVQLDGGRFATSDLNDLYRRVINRNNRLKRLLELGAPDVIVRNEKRMLQEAVDSLIDNSARGKAISARGRRKFKSLSDMLKGKQGRFRRNLLGKRVDYSGRSVIVVGPHLQLHQCGLPRTMALELFRPFVMHKLVEYNYAHNVKGAKRFIEQMKPEVWQVLEEVVKDYPVLLNRAPTLHRLGIQAFEPVLVEGSAIQIHPLVCTAFNADFDGDQMAVHIPLSEEAKREARELMLSTKNLLLPANGEPVVGPAKDMVLGCYYLTMEREGVRGEGKIFADMDEAVLAYDLGKIDLQARIKVFAAIGKKRKVNKLVETTVGRVIFNQALPDELRFINEVMDKSRLKKLVAECYSRLGPEETAKLVDQIKTIGFRYATQSGITIAVDDITIPEAKTRIIEETSEQVDELERQYRRGLITQQEQYDKTVELWTEATDNITDAVREAIDPNSAIRVMADSGATKGGFQPIRQLAGMRGLMADPAGRIIPLPIRSNFREGLTALEYFISTHGARKGLADTALRTADAGYLTRRLVDVAQDTIVNAEDCGTSQGITIRQKDSAEIGETFKERIFGRLAARPIVHPKTGEVLVEAGQMIEEEPLERIIETGVEEVEVRSPLTCELRHGICAKCYGRDLARGGPVKIGEAVGIIAAQSIGEPGTQLTLRTFHTGGIAGVEDITHGLPRVQELFEARVPKGQAIIADIGGRVEVIHTDGMRMVRIVYSETHRDTYKVPKNFKVLVEEKQPVDTGTVLARRGQKEIAATRNGVVTSIREDAIVVRHQKREEREYDIPPAARLRVEDGQTIAAGEPLIDGPKNPHHILRIEGRDATQIYLVEEVQKVYRSQGVEINDKHIEVIVRQMLRKVRVKTAGDTGLLPGELVDRLEFEGINARVQARGGRPATFTPLLLGVTKAALSTESFLSAASFQHTINVLAGAAIEGKIDELYGLKENVIIGKLIPAGTGFRLKSLRLPEGVIESQPLLGTAEIEEEEGGELGEGEVGEGAALYEEEEVVIDDDE